MFTSELNEKAWDIRKKAAAKFNYPVKVISWKLCLSLARQELNSIVGRTANCEFGTKNIELKITETNEWTGGSNSRTYLEIKGLEKMYGITKMFIDNSKSARLRAYDFTVDTDRGTVVIECSDKQSHAKKDALEDSLWALLDN